MLGELRQANPTSGALSCDQFTCLAKLRQAISLGVQEIMVDPLEMSDLENKVNKVLKAQKRNLKEALAL